MKIEIERRWLFESGAGQGSNLSGQTIGVSFVEMRRIEKRFGATVALDGVDLLLDQGEVHALVGENGSGKSTLMRVLAGVMKADAGEISLGGQPYRPSSPMDARRNGIAMIHQELSICGDLTVAENVLLGMETVHGGVIDKRDMHSRAREALSTLGHGGLDLDAPTKTLPIGVCQIVEIARAMAVGSKVVILDEPTSSLSEPDVQRLFDVVRTLRAAGHAIVYISHFLDEIEAVADRVSILRDGTNVITKPAHELSQSQIVSHMVGRSIDSIYPHTSRTPGEVILDVSNLTGDPKPTNASLDLRRGEVVGIAGLNGSGRTEFVRCLFGLDRVRAGDVKVEAVGSTNGRRATPHIRWLEGIGMLSEDRKLEGLALSMSIADNLTLTSLPPIVSDRKQVSSAADWIQRAAIKCREPGQAVGELSGGNQQKVAFARLLYHDVDVLLLDEPTRGIDVGSKQQIYQMIDELAKSGKAVIMISSYLPELLGVCDRIAVMSKGMLGTARPVSEVDQESIMREATGV